MRFLLSSTWRSVVQVSLIPSLLLAFGICSLPTSGAEVYLEQKVGLDKDAEKAAIDAAKEALQGTKSLSEVRAAVEPYYTKGLFPQMTRTTPEALYLLGRERSSLLDSLERVTAQDVRAYLNDLTFNSLKPIVVENYHPAVRYNAVLIIGELNSRQGSGDTTPPIPYSQALSFLIDQMESANQLDGVKVGALIGITRMAIADASDTRRDDSSKVTQQSRDRLVPVLSSLVTAKSSPDRPADVHRWMQQRAVEALTWIGSGKREKDGEIFNLVASVIQNRENPLALRTSAIASLSRLQPPTDANLAPIIGAAASSISDAIQNEMARLDGTIQAIKDEDFLRRGGNQVAASTSFGDDSGVNQAAENQKAQMKKMKEVMEGMGFGSSKKATSGSAGQKSNPDDDLVNYRRDYLRRRIRAQLVSVSNGLFGQPTAPDFEKREVEIKSGLYAFAKNPAEKKLLLDVADALKYVQQTTVDDLNVTSLRNRLLKNAKRIQSVLPSAQKVEDAGDGEDTDDEE